MNKPPNEIFDVLGSHFSEALAEPEEALQSIITELEKYHSEERYKFIKELGMGGLKKVTLEEDKVTHRQVAISTLIPELPKEEILRFVNEAFLTARLGHNNIVPLYDFGRRNGEFYFSTKYLDGESFEFYLSKDYQLSEVLRFFTSICDGVSFAHSQGVVHLDLKPSNIQISSHSEVIVFDWGLARDLKSDDGLECYYDEIFAGSPGYTAPEQILSQSEELDERTDLYSLGAVLYRILTGEHPWKDPDFEKILEQTVKGDQHPLRQKLQKVQAPESLVHVCLKALSKSKINRYESVDDLKNEVNSYLNGFATKAEEASYFKMLFLLIKRHKIPFALTAAFLMALGVILTIYNEELDHRQSRIEILNESKAEVLNDQAKKLYDSFKLDEAEKTIISSLGLNKTSDSQYLMARILLVKGHYLEAKDLIKSVDPDDSGELRIQKALIAEAQGKEDDFYRLVQFLNKEHMPGLVLNMVRYKYEQIPSLEDKIALAHRLFELLTNQRNSYSITIEEDGLIFKSTEKFNRLIPLVGLPFKEIDISGAITYNIESLRGMKTLKRLNLANTYVEDLSPISGLNLDYLNISNTCVVNIKALENTRIGLLDARGQKFVYLTNLVEMTKIEKVMLEVSRYKSYKDRRELETLSKQDRLVNE